MSFFSPAIAVILCYMVNQFLVIPQVYAAKCTKYAWVVDCLTRLYNAAFVVQIDDVTYLLTCKYQ